MEPQYKIVYRTESIRRTIFRTPLNAEHVQVCELAVIEMATVGSYASGTATGSVFLGKT